MQEISIIGAKKHNLKNIDLNIPKNKLIAITGVSGSGKSTLAYDTIFQEGQRKYLESLSIYARQFMKSLEKPEVQSIKGISPTISIDQKHSSYYFNSTVGTISDVSQYLRLLYSKVGEPHCYECGRKIVKFSYKKIIDYIFENFNKKLIQIFSPVIRNRKGTYKALFEKFLKRGFLKVLVDGKIYYLDAIPDLIKNVRHDISILIDIIEVLEENRNQIKESISISSNESNGEVLLISDGNEYNFSERLFCSSCKIFLKEPQPATFSFNSPLGACNFCNGTGLNEYNYICKTCKGSGLNREALSFYFKGKNIFELGEMEICDLFDFFKGIDLDRQEEKILSPILPHIVSRLESFLKLNLGYISLNRKINTLSGGELQRTRLVSQIGFALTGIIYILDEPSIGMHISEQNKLINILNSLKKKGNTIIVVEHDENTIKASDFIVDLGPFSGEKGGNIIYSGWYKDFRDASDSLTSDYIYRKEINLNKNYKRDFKDYIELKGISINNINNIDLKIPLQSLSVVTGVSGSGKSSLIIDAFYSIMKSSLENGEIFNKRLKYSDILYDRKKVDRILKVDQKAIGKNSRSCPATYINIMPLIRELFAGLVESKIRGYDQARFSFNVKGGRCEACNGLGNKKIEMSFLPQLKVQCPVCGGKRYNSETLKVKYKGLTISDILDLTADEAYELFKNIPFLSKKIKILVDVGLGYLKLGQSSATLSGGESQRIKLTKELSRISSKSTVYVFDEPTIGLHFYDIQNLINVFNSLIIKGNTIVVIEHNMEIIRAADYIVDLGPGGGNKGGNVIYQGDLNGILDCKNSITSLYLKERIENAN